MTETNSEIGLSKIELHFEVVLEYTINGPSADFLINIHAAKTHHQFVIEEQLTVDPTVSYRLDADTAGNRWLRLRAYSGTQQVSYRATVSLTHEVSVPDSLSEMPIGELPFAVLPYLRPSRYCQSDRLMRLATNEFSAYAPGYARVHAIQEWVRKRVAFQPQTSNVSTSAMDTLIEQVGVCRDYAHLMIALCRAMNIPARCATGIDYGADPALGPIDFHAYVEVFLSGRWYIFDPSGLAIPMGFLRIGTGRDAADVAFATIFGNVQTGMPRLHAEARQDFKDNIILPFHTPNLLSTAAL